MHETSLVCPSPNYSHIVHSPEGISSLAPQLNYITDQVLELKTELAKIKSEVKEIRNQLSLIHLSLLNEIRHSRNATPSSTAFQQKYPFQNPKNKISFPLNDIKIQKEVGEKSSEKSIEKEEKEDKDGV